MSITAHVSRLRIELDALEREHTDLDRKLKYQKNHLSAPQLRIHRNRKKELSKQIKNIKVQIELLE